MFRNKVTVNCQESTMLGKKKENGGTSQKGIHENEYSRGQE